MLSLGGIPAARARLAPRADVRGLGGGRGRQRERRRDARARPRVRPPRPAHPRPPQRRERGAARELAPLRGAREGPGRRAPLLRRLVRARAPRRGGALARAPGRRVRLLRGARRAGSRGGRGGARPLRPGGPGRAVDRRVPRADLRLLARIAPAALAGLRAPAAGGPRALPRARPAGARAPRLGRARRRAGRGGLPAGLPRLPAVRAPGDPARAVPVARGEPLLAAGGVARVRGRAGALPRAGGGAARPAGPRAGAARGPALRGRGGGSRPRGVARPGAHRAPARPEPAPHRRADGRSRWPRSSPSSR